MRLLASVIWSTVLMGSAFSVLGEAWPELTHEREIELSLSAAPEHLRAGAAVYVLGEKGFEKVRDSENGFSCMVIRAGNVFAPVCYDAEGSKTTLHTNLRQAELEASGMAVDKIQEIITAEYESGKLKAPGRPGIAYMLSKDFVQVDPETREATNVYPPHLMFYAPYMTDEDIGAPKDHNRTTKAPWVLNPGTPSAYIIVVPPEHQPSQSAGPQSGS